MCEAVEDLPRGGYRVDLLRLEHLFVEGGVEHRQSDVLKDLESLLDRDLLRLEPLLQDVNHFRSEVDHYERHGVESHGAQLLDLTHQVTPEAAVRE